MPDREMVIKGLECCLPEDYEYAGNNPCIDCPYYHGSSCGSQQLLRNALELLREQKTMNWISVKDRLPEQHDTIFAKLKGTDKWKKGLFEKQSDDVRVVIEYPDGYRRVHHSYLVDGVWACETLPPEGRKVLYWCENPELPKEEG